MRCCVPDCKNDSRNSSKSQGITFHAFPTTPSHRTAWLKALNKHDWHPKERSAVCSVHFLTDDLYITKNGLRKVRAGAVPMITTDFTNGYDYGKISSVQACRMCLATDHTLVSMRHYNLDRMFEAFTGLSLSTDDRLPKHICSECAQRLLNAVRFKNRTLKANSLLVEVLEKQNVLTEETIKTIDRENHNLSSQLTTKHNQPDQFDLELEYIELKQEPETVEVPEEHAEEPLEADNIFVDEINDFDGIKNDSATDDEADKNFEVPGKNEDFESEDSLPLEVARKKKKKIKNSVKKVAKEIDEPKIDRRRRPFMNHFTVTNLTFEEQIAEIEKRQETDNYKHSVFKCMECYKGFLDQDAYNSHMTRHTDEGGQHRCAICKIHFQQSHALRKHITAHHTQRFSCNQCSYETTHRQTARLHERWHKGTRYTCPHCPEVFVKFTTYMGHVRIKHPSDFVCELCGYSFVSAKGIELHKKLKHRSDSGPIPSDGPYCNECGVRFATTDAHLKHLAVSARHSSKESREANKANKGRKTKEMRDNMRKMESEQDDSRPIYPSQLRKAEGPIPCEQCGVQLEDSRAYHSHFRRMHPDKNRTKYPSMKSPCMCELCGRIFQSYALLKDHRWTHTTERPFKCDQCDKSFRMKQRLVAHRRVHSSVRASYVCAVCGKHFSTHSNRQRHMFIHTGLKPFKCEMCGKGFKHASEKRAHVTYVHLKKPWPKRSRGKRLARQGSPPQGESNEMDIQPVWPSCDPKLTDINILDDKPMYYNLKI